MTESTATATAAEREVKELEQQLAAAKRRVVAPKSLAEEIVEAELMVTNLERQRRIATLKIESLERQRRSLSADAETGPANFDLRRVAKSKLAETENAIGTIAREKDTAEGELSKAQTNVANLLRRRDEKPEYASFLEKNRTLTKSFEKMAADAVAAAARAREVLGALDRLAREEQILVSSSHQDFIRLGLISAETICPSSQLQKRCSELRARFQRDLD